MFRHSSRTWSSRHILGFDSAMTGAGLIAASRCCFSIAALQMTFSPGRNDELKSIISPRVCSSGLVQFCNHLQIGRRERTGSNRLAPSRSFLVSNQRASGFNERHARGRCGLPPALQSKKAPALAARHTGLERLGPTFARRSNFRLKAPREVHPPQREKWPETLDGRKRRSPPPRASSHARSPHRSAVRRSHQPSLERKPQIVNPQHHALLVDLQV
jgi:hypothetical protein